MSYDFDVSGVDVLVGFDEVGSEDAGEELGGCDGVFFGFDVDYIFHRVRCDNDAVVCFCVSAPLVSLEFMGA